MVTPGVNLELSKGVVKILLLNIAPRVAILRTQTFHEVLSELEGCIDADLYAVLLN